MTKLIAAALLSAFAFAFTSAPVTFDVASGKLTVSSAFASHGADDVLGGVDPAPHP